MTSTYALPMAYSGGAHAHDGHTYDPPPPGLLSAERSPMLQSIANGGSLRKAVSNGSLHAHSHLHSHPASHNHNHILENHRHYQSDAHVPRQPYPSNGSFTSSEGNLLPMRNTSTTAYPEGSDYGIPAVGKTIIPARSHSHTEMGHSRVTQVLLEWAQRYPLLHNILVEKDSRRIFYFMT